MTVTRPFVLDRLRELGKARYESLPSVAQDVLCSAYGAQEVVRRRGWPWRARRLRERVEALHRDRVRARAVVERRLGLILEAARATPGAAGAAPSPSEESPLEELSRWPVLTKEQLRKAPRDYLSRDVRPSDIHTLTSGTSGTPLDIWRPRQAFRELFACAAVFTGWFGVRPGGRRASFTGKVVVPPDSDRVWRVDLVSRRLVLSQYHLGPLRVEAYARALRRWRPEVLDGYTSNLVELARLFDDAGISLQVPLIVTTCEVLTASGRQLLERVFQGRVADKYGTSENAAYACECPEGRRHVFQNMGIIEVLDDDDRPVPDGASGRLVLTTLTNDLMPLVRYEVGDMGAVVTEPDCACGRTSPVLAEILGRQDDVVVTPDGRRVAIFAFNLLRGVRGVVAFQVVQHAPSDFTVRAVLEGAASGEERRQFEETIDEAFDRLLGPDPDRTVTYRYPETIERSLGGKIRNIVREF